MRLPSFDRQARCRILAVLRLSLFLSLKTTLKLSLMEKMIAMVWIGSSESPDTLQYKGKTEAEPSEVEDAREGKRATGGSTGHHGRGSHHGPWCPPRPGRGAHWRWWPVFPPCAAFWGRLVLCLGPRILLFLGSFGPPCKLLLILIAHTSLAWIHLKHFSPNLGLNHRNLQ